MNRHERRASKAQTKRGMRCPCGGFIVDDPETMIIRHTNPQCQRFIDGMAACGMKPFRERWAEAVDIGTGEVLTSGWPEGGVKGAGKA